MQNMGCDMRVLQMYDAKDPDEFILKYGTARFQKLLDDAISLVEFKIKNLQKNLNLENASDKIKFLNEIAILISRIDNTMEREIYIEKISKGYNISKEAIYAQVNKLQYANKKDNKVLEKDKTVMVKKRQIQQKNVSEEVIKRENTIISILINNTETYETIKKEIAIDDFKDERNKKILQYIYTELEKETANLNSILDHIDDEIIQNHFTEIMAEDYGITDVQKAISDILQKYEREKLEKRRDEILIEEENECDLERKKQLGKELNDIILKLVKIK